MLDELIIEGEKLESEAQGGIGGIKFFKSVNFEKWVAKSIFYLETKHSKSIITEKARTQYQSLNTNTNHNYYQSLLGSLKAAKEFEEYQESEREKEMDALANFKF